jgi:REP element-mobilizing transposase RayT
MVIASHAIVTCYGFWLPNDHRGSWSNEVWARHLIPFGEATKTSERRSLANRPFDRAKSRAAKATLKYPPVRFNGFQARAVARGFAGILQKLDLRVFACAIMPDHVHILMGKHFEPVETVMGYLKRAASRRLSFESIHPLEAYRSANGSVPTAWAVGGWVRYLDAWEDVAECETYVEQNPLRAGFKRQIWGFVAPLKPAT